MFEYSVISCFRFSNPSWPRAGVSAPMRPSNWPWGVPGQRLECPVGQLARIGAGCGGNGARIGGAEGAGDCFVGIVEAVLDRVRQPHVLPHQVERLGSILNGDPVDDGPAAEFQVVHEIPAPSRIDDRARPADRRHPMPHLSGKLGRALRGGKLESEQPPGRGSSLADLDQQFGEALSPEGLQVPDVESFLRCHIVGGWNCSLDGQNLDRSLQIAQ